MNDIFGDSDRFCTVEDTMEMKYLDCAIKESMRLYPSIPAIMRKLSEEVQIGILLMILLKSMFGYTAMQYFCCYCTKGDYKLPSGISVAFMFYAMHHNPQIFQDPEVFKPERFLYPEANSERHPFSFLPFSAGNRNCIGNSI